jgi:GNAT superfamily N-acetyltransferase
MMVQLPSYPRSAEHPNVTISRATKRNLDSLLPLFVAFREETERRVDEMFLHRRLAEMISRREGRLHVIFAREGRFPVGYVMGVFFPSVFHMGTVFWVQELFIDRPYRGGPVLRKLYNWARRYALSRGAVCIEVRFSRNALRLHSLSDALGFDPTSVELFEQDLGGS